MATVIGVVSGVVTIYSFLESLFGGSDGGGFDNLRVGAGLDGAQGQDGPLSGSEGNIRVINVFNEHQEKLGSTNGHYIDSGGYADFTVHQGNTQQATFVQLESNTDALCVAYVTIVQADGQKRGWNGDWGRQCGLLWYNSDIYIDQDSDRKTECTWIDQDHTNGIQAGSLIIHMPSFASGSTNDDNANDYCGYPALRAYSSYDSNSGPIFKRDDAELPMPQKDQRLIVSNHIHHNATDLCNSPTSYGPDFVSLADGFFCNMETREVLPVCNGDDDDEDCFHVEKKAALKSRSLVAPRAYTNVLQWGQN